MWLRWLKYVWLKYVWLFSHWRQDPPGACAWKENADGGGGGGTCLPSHPLESATDSLAIDLLRNKRQAVAGWPRHFRHDEDRSKTAGSGKPHVHSFWPLGGTFSSALPESLFLHTYKGGGGELHQQPQTFLVAVGSIFFTAPLFVKPVKAVWHMKNESEFGHCDISKISESTSSRSRNPGRNHVVDHRRREATQRRGTTPRLPVILLQTRHAVGATKLETFRCWRERGQRITWTF